MPYYCTVPQCTSMAGKAKNVSFHQFPRDEELARLWNLILKRGKPYTKYSKVCSLHFRPEDYTITSVGKNKGQWRTLRKDAIPSRNLPSSTPPPTNHHHSGNRRNSGAWLPGASPAPAPSSVDPRLQHQMAQAIYMQTMLAMQARHSENESLTGSEQQRFTISDIEQLLQQRHVYPEVLPLENTSYKCDECSKCFKDPDVFVLHKRTHVSRTRDSNSIHKDIRRVSGGDVHEKQANDYDGQDNDTEKQTNDYDRQDNDTDRINRRNKNHDGNQDNDSNDRLTDHGSVVENGSKQETLRANPILANLLRTGVDGVNGTVFDVNNILSIENQIMTALAANMETYIKNLTHMLAEAKKEKVQDGQDTEENDRCQSDGGSDQDNENERCQIDGGSDQDNENYRCQSDRQSDQDNDTISERQSNLNEESDGENCQITDNECHNDDGIGKKSDQKSKNKSKNKSVANKSKSIKKRGRKSRASMKKVNESSRITKIHDEFSGNDLEKHEAMDVDHQNNDALTNDGQTNDVQTSDDCSKNLYSSQNDKNPKVESINYHLQENEYDAENLDIQEPKLVTGSDSLSPIKNKGLNSIRGLETENYCENRKENHESQNCTLTYQNQYEKSLHDEQNPHLVSISKSNCKSERINHSNKVGNSKIEQNSEVTSKIEQDSLTADKEASKNCQNNIKTDNLREVDLQIEPNSLKHHNNTKICENIVKTDEISPQKSLNDENSVINVLINTGDQSPKYENKCVQTDETYDEIENSLYPALACDNQDLKPSKDSQIGLDDSL